MDGIFLEGEEVSQSTLVLTHHLRFLFSLQRTGAFTKQCRFLLFQGCISIVVCKCGYISLTMQMLWVYILWTLAIVYLIYIILVFSIQFDI